MPSIFTRIVEGEIPSYKVAEDDRFLAFLDINPLAEGHTLVVPKQEIDYLFDLPPDLLGDLMKFTQKVALAMDRVFDCERIGVSVIGLEVPHAHVHLIPIKGIFDMDFSQPKMNFTAEQFETVAQKIRENII
ncbi:MAG TPA: HIT family protein [Flavobacteriales bacterium]|jgi:histidine triad (HIT) family protein|nr:HIT family protein [Flavobacteriales bacterium]